MSGKCFLRYGARPLEVRKSGEGCGVDLMPCGSSSNFPFEKFEICDGFRDYFTPLIKLEGLSFFGGLCRNIENNEQQRKYRNTKSESIKKVMESGEWREGNQRRSITGT